METKHHGGYREDVNCYYTGKCGWRQDGNIGRPSFRKRQGTGRGREAGDSLKGGAVREGMLSQAKRI